MQWQKYFLTFFGLGQTTKNPQLVSAIAALTIGTLICVLMGTQTLFMIALAASLIGIFELNKYENQTGIHDDPEVVIDGVVGVWLSLLIAYSSASNLSDPFLVSLSIPLSFVSFYYFAITKPSTIGWIHRNIKGGLGTMGDDILSGFAGGFLSVLILLGIDKFVMN